MKRHDNLAHLSREHHQWLILAQVLKADSPDYPRLPKTVPGKLGFAQEKWSELIQPHIQREEQILFPAIRGFSEKIDQLILELEDDHTEIEIGFNRLEADANVIQAMDNLGHLLEEHVRKEERQFFQLIQDEMPNQVESLSDRLKA